MLYEIVKDFPNELFETKAETFISLYQPTHRHGPENQQDPIRFKNLIREVSQSLDTKYDKKQIESLLKPFEALAADKEFWQHTADGMAVFATESKCIVYILQRPVEELAVVADSFHIKPLIRIFQSADRYHLLGINRNNFTLYEGNRYGFEKVKIDSELPQTAEEILGKEFTESHVTAGGRGAGGSVVFHGAGSKKDEIDKDIERYFRSVDRLVLDNYSRPMGLPLILVSLDEYHTPFHNLSHNPFLQKEGIKADYETFSIEELRERAWAKLEPVYIAKTKALIDEFENARAQDQGSDDIVQVAKAAAENRVNRVLIESDRIIPGKIDAETGALTEEALENPVVDDILDDLAELVFKNKGEVVLLPKERMPNDRGVAATYRY
ncbi:hypothetical protein ACFSFY_02205 [Sporosarcina siberiensis]|uniref:Peptide chain release factor 1 (ERF1) n=1 Tax=Sporosarcina siberiensis TaxID=1365606 RepID=A0ABW4SBR1_9BACL